MAVKLTKKQIKDGWQVGRVELKKQYKKLFTALEEVGFCLANKSKEVENG